jgi:hypothetical protein
MKKIISSMAAFAIASSVAAQTGEPDIKPPEYPLGLQGCYQQLDQNAEDTLKADDASNQEKLSADEKKALRESGIKLARQLCDTIYASRFPEVYARLKELSITTAKSMLVKDSQYSPKLCEGFSFMARINHSLKAEFTDSIQAKINLSVISQALGNEAISNMSDIHDEMADFYKKAAASCQMRFGA